MWPWNVGLTVVVLGCTVSVLGGPGCIAFGSVEQTGRKVSPSSRAEAWNMKSVLPSMFLAGGVLQEARSLGLLLCVYT